MPNSLDCEFGIEKVSDFKNTSTGDGMVDPAMRVMGLLEEIIDVVVLGHIALDEARGRNFSGKVFGGGCIDVAKVDVGSLLA